MAGKPYLSDVQRSVLRRYAEHAGPTIASYGSLTTWKVLVRRGLLARSSGLGVIETEITPAGLLALQEGGGDA